MNNLLAFINNPQKLYKTLLGYWIITPLLYLAYAYFIARETHTDVREFLNTPTVALAFLVSCMTLVMAGLLKLAASENENTLRIFTMYAAFQQLLVGNLIGLLLALFLSRTLWWEQRERFAPRQRWVLLTGMGLIGFLALLVVLIGLNFFHIL
ncbi:cell shape determination protein CcmA [uncultured Rothia sp.]|uniref:cell shape determination protein CcmA n=1 Tax=uncultured Rothia sp. TaxID=316088 RepID=UPI0032180078